MKIAQTSSSHQNGGSRPSDKQEDLPKGWEEAGQLLANRGIVAVRAHLLHEDLGGPGTPKNLAVTCKGINNKLYANFEKTVIGWVNEGTTVDLEVTVEYSGNSPYPKAFKVRASRLDCQKSTKDKPICNEVNPSGGILAEIDITNCTGAIKR